MEVGTNMDIISQHRDNKNVIGQFLLGKTVGEGTFGKVKLGTHIVTGERVAIKILEKIRILDESDKIRIDREIKILKSLMHHNIIQIYSVIENPTTIFLIMEYANGGELYDYIVLKKRLSDFEACKFFHQIINGVEYIHKVGVVHRDLKPENLLLDHKNNVKIVDFGLSNIYNNGLNFRTPCGSPCYAAPEMIQGKIYNGMQVDIWSIGVILFAMLCGFLPFDDQDNDVLYSKIIEGNFVLPNFLSDNAKDLLKNILNTDPEKRYTLKQIRSHPWFNRIPVMINEGLLINVINIPVDENLLEQMKMYGYRKEEVRENIVNNRHNNATTTYYLLMKSQYRNGISSVSDLVSIEFLRHIRNPHNLKFGSSRPNGLVDSNVTYTNILENKSNFASNICTENEVLLTDQNYSCNDFVTIEEKKTNIYSIHDSIPNTDEFKITVYDTNFYTESSNLNTMNNPNSSIKSIDKKSAYKPNAIQNRVNVINKENEKQIQSSRIRANSLRSPIKDAYRSSSTNKSVQSNVKHMTLTNRKPNKINVPANIPSGAKNIKKKIEEQYEKYVKNPATNRVSNKFKKGFLNTSAIFEKSAEVRSKSIADKYKSENNKYGSHSGNDKYGSHNGNKTPSVSKRVSEQSPLRVEAKKSPMNSGKASLKSRPPLSNKKVSGMKKAFNRSCPDITDKSSKNDTIFTIKEEKEEMNNTIKLDLNNQNHKENGLIQGINQHKSKDKLGSSKNSGAKSVTKNQTGDTSRMRLISSSKERTDYNSNYHTGKSKADDDTINKKNTKTRLSVPKNENVKLPPSSDTKTENKKIMTPAISDSKEANVKVPSAKDNNNNNPKNKLREINKAITSRKKEPSKNTYDDIQAVNKPEKTKHNINDVSITGSKLETEDSEIITPISTSRNTNSKNSGKSGTSGNSGNKTKIETNTTKTRPTTVTTKNAKPSTKQPNANIKTIKVVDSGVSNPSNLKPSITINSSASTTVLNKSHNIRPSSMAPLGKSDEIVINSSSYDLNNPQITQEKFMDDLLKVLQNLKIKYKPVPGNKYKYSCSISKLAFEAEIVKDLKENKLFAKFKMNDGSSSEFKNICNKILSFVKF